MRADIHSAQESTGESVSEREEWPRSHASRSMMAHRESTMRVAYVIQNAGNDLREDVGQAILIKHTVRGLQNAGHQVTIYRLHGQSIACIEDMVSLEATQYAQLGLSATRPFRLIESGLRRLQREVRFPYLALFDAYRFYEACNRLLPGFDICHEYGGLFSIGASVTCSKKGIPYVLTVEADPFLENEIKGTPLRGLQARLARREARIAYGLADRILTVSEPAKQHLIQTWHVAQEKIIVMPNGVDISLFRPVENQDKLRAAFGFRDEPVIGFVGGFQRWHGLDILVESFAGLRSDFPDAKLLLVGDGPARPHIEEDIDKRGLKNSVVITGLVPQVRVPEMLGVIDVAVLPYPSLPTELWFSPLKLFEYMAAGKAIVASRSGQIAEVLRDDDTAILVEPGDITELTHAIGQLLSCPSERQRLGQHARRQAVEHHSWDQYIQRLEQVYRSVR